MVWIIRLKLTTVWFETLFFAAVIRDSYVALLKTIDESDVIVNRNLTLLFDFTIYGAFPKWNVNFAPLVIKCNLEFFGQKKLGAGPFEMSRRWYPVREKNVLFFFSPPDLGRSVTIALKYGPCTEPQWFMVIRCRPCFFSEVVSGFFFVSWWRLLKLLLNGILFYWEQVWSDHRVNCKNCGVSGQFSIIKLSNFYKNKNCLCITYVDVL